MALRRTGDSIKASQTHSQSHSLSRLSESLSWDKTGKSPVIENTDAKITLSESGAICDYIIYRYANGKLALKLDDPHYPDYLYWVHFANASQQATMVVSMFIAQAEVPDEKLAKQSADEHLKYMLQQTDDQLKDNKWLAGPVFSVADIMSVYGVTTQR